MCGQMADNLMENGKRIICTEGEYILGKMGGSTRVNISMIKRQAMGFILGLMAGDMLAAGKTENNMERASISFRMEWRE